MIHPSSHSPAIAVESSSNRKTGPISATYLAQPSCPASCPLIDGGGCYAETGVMGIHTQKLNSNTATLPARRITPAALARVEALAIKSLTGTLPMRLHVVGDAKTNEAARIMARAVADYRKRGHRAFPFYAQPVWTYTHAWRRVQRTSWGPDISVLASCETINQVGYAMSLGYPAALVVDRHPADGKAWTVAGISGGGVAVIPCPAQTREDVRCVDCQLCWKGNWLLAERKVIAFEAHGRGTEKVKRTLIQIETTEKGKTQ